MIEVTLEEGDPLMEMEDPPDGNGGPPDDGGPPRNGQNPRHPGR